MGAWVDVSLARSQLAVAFAMRRGCAMQVLENVRWQNEDLAYLMHAAAFPFAVWPRDIFSPVSPSTPSQAPPVVSRRYRVVPQLP